MTSPDRFFAATILDGCLYVDGVPDWGPWDSSRLDRFTKYEIEPGLVEVAGDRVVRTVAELEEVLKAPTGQTPTLRVWIHESLEGEARRG
jgi:hypothetical protein